MVKKKKEEEVKVEVQEEVPVDTSIINSLATQEFLNSNRENLFKEIPSLITAEFYENPPRVMLVVSAKLDTLPVKEHNGSNIVFDQMILGGVVIQKDLSPASVKTFSTNANEVADLNQDIFGKDCIGPHNNKTRNTKALEDWKKRNKNVKVSE